MKRRWLAGFAAALALVLAAGAAYLAVQRSGGGKASERDTEVHGIAAEAAEAGDREHSRGALSKQELAAATSFGPNVGTGVFQGVSPAVSDLPVLPVAPVTQVQARDFENLHATTQARSGNDPVVQKHKGTGPISAPLQRFDGICLPFWAAVWPGEQLQLFAAGHEWRSRAVAIRADGEHRLRRLLEDRAGAANRDADQPALVRRRR